jgi:hypothetical protein
MQNGEQRRHTSHGVSGFDYPLTVARKLRKYEAVNFRERQLSAIHDLRDGTHEVSERAHVFSDADPAPVVAADRPTLGIFAACACYR